MKNIQKLCATMGAHTLCASRRGREMLAKDLGKRKKENFFDYYKYLIIINICIYKKIPLRVIGEALLREENFLCVYFNRALR